MTQTKKVEHTATPWSYKQAGGGMIGMKIESVNGKIGFTDSYENATFIVKAVNSHEALVEACKHASMSFHHPSCSHGKRGDGNTCECHVTKAQKALKLAGEA